MRVLELKLGASASEWGRTHGLAFASEIERLYQIRLGLTLNFKGFANERAVLASAGDHLDVLRRFDTLLFDELVGIADGASLSPEHIVVLNHYTDLRDIDAVPPTEAHLTDGGCTMVYANTPKGPVLAQTWDTHESATEFVIMMRVPARDTEAGPAPELWVFSVVGCLGMAGLNSHGLGVGINNLRSLDAGVGVVWSALVRKMLRGSSAQQAADTLFAAQIGSGHHYLAADLEGALAIETSGVEKEVVHRGRGTFVHTNHCFDPTVAACSAVSSTSSTYRRLEFMQASVDHRPLEGATDTWDRMTAPEISVANKTPELADGIATCGGVLMDLERREIWAQTGLMTVGGGQVFSLESA